MNRTRWMTTYLAVLFLLASARSSLCLGTCPACTSQSSTQPTMTMSHCSTLPSADITATTSQPVRPAATQPANSQARDLPEVLQAGVLRHLGVPYAHFVTGGGDGLDVELIQQFAKHLGVQYEYVRTDWKNVIPDLIGRNVQVKQGKALLAGPSPVRGDVIANGLTVLPWRQEVLEYSAPTFPTQIWLIARADSPIHPITATGNIDQDVSLTKALLKGISVLGKADTCLEPSLYGLTQTGADVRMFTGGLNEIAPAVIEGAADASILDVPDSLVALDKWPGKIKVVGPISRMQDMAVGFPKTSPKLRQAFDVFLKQRLADGTYQQLVRKYYPSVFAYYPKFFAAPADKTDTGSAQESNYDASSRTSAAH